MTEPDENLRSAADSRSHPILWAPLADDSAVPTQSRYAYQHHCTARLVFAMLGTPHVVLVVCETHEDALVFYMDARVELVSVKHRDDQTLPLSALREALVQLFRRWQHTGRVARCRLMTNGKPASGAKKSGGLIEACHARKPGEWVGRMKTWTGSQDDSEVGEFLAGFSVDAPTGNREHIRAINCQEVVAPALATAKLDAVTPAVAYDRVVKLIHDCNQDLPVNDQALLNYLANPDRATPEARAGERIGRRAIDRARLLEVLVEPQIPPPQVQLSFDDPMPRQGSTLARKLSLGGLGPTTVEAARTLRANWEALETRWRADVPGGDPTFDDLRARALALAAKAERATMTPATTYGADMHSALESMLTVDALDRKPPFAISDDLLLGLAYELTDECRIWWSARQPL